MSLLKNEPVIPNWEYLGTGGRRQICKIYGLTTTHAALADFFKPSNFSLNSTEPIFSFGNGLLYSHLTDKYLDLHYNEVTARGGYIKFLEATKENAQGAYYECALELDPDTDNLNRWLKELNSHGRASLFVVLFKDGGGRVIGNFNGGMKYGSKFDAGGKRRAQGRDIAYSWDSHHPSFYIDETDAELLDGYVRYQPVTGGSFGTLNGCISYFTNRLDQTPYAFKKIGADYYFRVPKGTYFNDSVADGLSEVFELEDPSGLTAGIKGVVNAFRSNGTSGGSQLIVQDWNIDDCNDVIFNIELLRAKSLKFTGVNLEVCTSVGEIDCPKIDVLGSIEYGSFHDVETYTNRPNIQVFSSGKIEASFHQNGLAGTDAILGTISNWGIIRASFNLSKFRFWDIFSYHTPSAAIDGSFNQNTKLYIKKVVLIGQVNALSFQDNTDVEMDLIETCNTAATAIISGFFDRTTNLRIKGKLGLQVWAENIGPQGFDACTGNLEFKTGYNTINAGGVEGDVAAILSKTAGGVVVLYNQ